jgi:cellobiose epimerase
MAYKKASAQMLTVLLLVWGATAAIAADMEREDRTVREREDRMMSGAHWRDQALKELMPLWREHVIDGERGAFHLNLSRSWQPMPPWDKVPAMISRQVFSFSAAYLLSGDEGYLDVAREGVDYLLTHAWDKEYGGWYNRLGPDGSPTNTTKTVSPQLYTNVGLTLYYFTTGDERAWSHVRKSLAIRQEHVLDEEFGGYYYALNRDLSVSDDGKTKHAHYGYVGSLLLHLYLATRDTDVLDFSKRLTDLTLDRMMGEEGWVYGYRMKMDRQWRPTPTVTEGRDVVLVGAQLTAALSFLRLYHQTGDVRYLEAGRALGDLVTRHGWDSAGGGWRYLVERPAPHRALQDPTISWWVQIYGSFLQLQLYHVTGDERYLECFKKSERFYDRFFMDRENGGVFASVSPEGELQGDGEKASDWHTSYHEIEHALLNYLQLNLYVNKEPAVLHFNLDGSGGGKSHYVSLVDDPRVRIKEVRIDGQPWEEFDAAQRSVMLPDRKGLRVEVTLSPAP